MTSKEIVNQLNLTQRQKDAIYQVIELIQAEGCNNTLGKLREDLERYKTELATAREREQTRRLIIAEKRKEIEELRARIDFYEQGKQL